MKKLTHFQFNTFQVFLDLNLKTMKSYDLKCVLDPSEFPKYFHKSSNSNPFPNLGHLKISKHCLHMSHPILLSIQWFNLSFNKQDINIFLSCLHTLARRDNKYLNSFLNSWEFLKISSPFTKWSACWCFYCDIPHEQITISLFSLNIFFFIKKFVHVAKNERNVLRGVIKLNSGSFYRISTLAAPFPWRVPVRVDFVSGAAKIYCDDGGPHHITFRKALRKFSDKNCKIEMEKYKNVNKILLPIFLQLTAYRKGLRHEFKYASTCEIIWIDTVSFVVS